MNTSHLKESLPKAYYIERVHKCYKAIPYYFIPYLIIITYFVLDDFRVFNNIAFTAFRIPSILLCFITLFLRFTFPLESKLKKYWIPLYGACISTIIYSLYGVTYLAFDHELFVSGLYIISAIQLLLFLYSILPISITLILLNIGFLLFILALGIGHYTDFINHHSSFLPLPNFIAISIATSFVLYIKYRNTFLSFQNLFLFKKEQEKTEALYQITLEQNNELSLQKEKISEQNDILSTQYLDIENSLQYAQRIQRTILPLSFYKVTKVSEYFVFNEPKHIVSGDFHWFGKTDTSQIIAIGDCTGHGVPGALMSMLAISLLDRLIQENISDPMHIIEKMHLRLNSLLQQKETSNEDGMAISILSIPLDPTATHFTFAGAKSPLTIIKKEKVSLYKGSRYYIGGQFSPINHCINHTIKIEDDMMAYMYSDGFEDQFGGIDNKKYKPAKFRSLLQDITDNSALIQKQNLSSEFHKWKNTLPDNIMQVDDVLVAGFRFTTSPQ
ncbi:hypothetical protein EI427_13145 [Flammeovirga pectinis]|uniref:PPM-type phosphatase domain-containing protein n=1 Tax=Flammeovirga pectinis TaxID=2494373 RepID=A0A3Q9FPT0_9BACT|nr:SpoIIE family protein phosphatase [Flammeovirga pectinis]AZQ63151.1 hypothetical protein EI427_13145 [Flammeovirga pectinis]